MFDKVGNEIKSIAKGYVANRVILMIAIDILACVAFWNKIFQNIFNAVFSILGLFLVTIVVYHRARLEAIKLYAYGEIVDDVETIKDIINARKQDETGEYIEHN